MNFLSSILFRKEFHIFLLFSSAAYFTARYLPIPYSDRDTLIYTLIGEAIYKEGIFPYGLIFDHKPFLIYFIYGPLSYIKMPFNIFSIFSVLWLLILSFISYTLILKRTIPFLAILFVLSAAKLGTVYYSGNSEIVYVPFEFLSIGFALRSANRPLWFILSAASAVAAASINYVSGFPLIPSLLFCLYVSSQNFEWFIKRSLGYLLTTFVILAIAFAILFYAGMDVVNYFYLQMKFISGYEETRLSPSAMFIFIMTAPFIAFLSALALGAKIKPENFNLTISMLTLSFLSAVSFLLSGKFFDHYLFMITAPMYILIISLNFPQIFLRALVSASLISISLFQLLKAYTGFDFFWPPQNNYALYEPLAEAVRDSPVMTMNVLITPLYFSRAIPFHPLVWSDHPQFIFGENSDQFFIDLLKKGPPFVITSYALCADSNVPSCVFLKNGYESIQSWPGKWQAPGYTLYKNLEIKDVTDNMGK